MAGELAASPDDYGVAFARHENEMRAYVEANQTFALSAMKAMAARTRTHLWFQIQMLRILPHLPRKDLIASKIRQDMKRISNAILLKDYEKIRKETLST